MHRKWLFLLRLEILAVPETGVMQFKALKL
jgi:hypothetical protein